MRQWLPRDERPKKCSFLRLKMKMHLQKGPFQKDILPTSIFQGTWSTSQNILGDSEDWLTFTFSRYFGRQQQLGEQKHSFFFVGIILDNETARFVKF